MLCPKCGSSNVFVQAVTTTKEKRKKGVLYWLIIGWWWELMVWVFFTLPKLIFALFGKHTKTVSETHTEAVCQNCGKRWKVSNAEVNRYLKSQPQPQYPTTNGKPQPQCEIAQASQQEYRNNQTEQVIAYTKKAISHIHSDEHPFYERPCFFWVMVFLFPPVAIALVWLRKKIEWTKKKKIIFTAVLGTWCLVWMLIYAPGNDTQQSADPAASNSVVSDSVVSYSSAPQKEPWQIALEKQAEIDQALLDSETPGETKCREAAEQYLVYSSFSRKGLGEQLASDKFAQSEIDYALSQMDLGVNWDEQAYWRAKDYLNSVPDYSRSALIVQLELDGFSHEQAVYGADKAYNE